MDLRQMRNLAPVLIALGVMVPALLLAGIAVYLTVRTANAVESGSARYNRYISVMVAEGFKSELLDMVRGPIAPAENVARSGGSLTEILAAMEDRPAFLDHPTLVPIDQLMDMTVIVVEGQAIIYTSDSRRGRRGMYAGTLLRGRDGDIIGAGGWWFDPGRFLERQLRPVVDLRMADDPNVFGGSQDMRALSVEVVDSAGAVRARVREPAYSQTAYTHPMDGPFEGYHLRVSASSQAAVSWIARFVGFEMAFIVLMVVVLAAAVGFTLRYTSKQLELAQHKASFVSNITHELKTPLALIRLAAETLEMRRLSSVEDQERFIRTIGRETERLTRLVDNVLDFSRLEAGRREFRLAPTDLAALTQEVFESFRPRLEELGFQTTLTLPPDLPMVRAEGQAVQQCLTNLMDNAIKYSRDR